MKTLSAFLIFFLSLSAPLSAQEYCRVRLLVAYTDSAMVQSGGVRAIEENIAAAVDGLNDSYFFSGVDHWVELVRTYQVPAPQAVCFMDELVMLSSEPTANGLRNRYGADVVAFIVDNPEFCGQNLAENQVANSRNAYVAVHYECLNGNFSLAHQLGHLYGCGHLHYEYEISDEAPFSYGHGMRWTFDDGPANFRTVMGIDCAENCSNQDPVYNCNMIPHWSNPERPYQQVLTGFPDRADNARVLREQASTLAGFRLLSADYSLPADSVLRGNFALGQGLDSLRNSGTYQVRDSARAYFRASSRIVLEPGFEVEEGAYFESLLDSTGTSCR